MALAAAGVLALGLRMVIPLLRRRDSVASKRPLPKPLLVATALPALGALALTCSLPAANHAFLGPAATALGAHEDSAYKLWHGWTPALGLGLGALLLALLVARLLLKSPLPPLSASFDPLFENIFHIFLRALRLAAKDVAKLLTGQTLPAQLAFLVLIIGGGVLLSLNPREWPAPDFSGGPNSTSLLLLTPFLIGAAVVVARTRDRLTLLVSLGFVGLLIAFLFLWFSAPDLALTQLLAETLLLFLLGIALTKVDLRAALRPSSWWRLPIALFAGVLVTALLLMALALDWGRPVSEFHLAQSKAAAYGANVVNVILVDFRALDTLGEILVLAIASLGATSALGAARCRATLPGTSSAWMGTGLPAVMVLLTLTALWIFWRGHNHSGGGFIGALILACALGLGILARQRQWTPPRLRRLGYGLSTAGLTVALLAALSPLLVDKPFFTGLWWHRGDLHLGTPLLFDLGVLLTVLGFACHYLRHFHSLPQPHLTPAPRR